MKLDITLLSVTFRRIMIQLWMLTLLALFCSCKKNTLTSLPPGQTPASFAEVFDAFWIGINSNYVYWDVDTTNWGNMYHTYMPLFAKLNISEYTDMVKSVQYFREMTKGFIDGHFRIIFTTPALSDSVIYPAWGRKVKAPDFHPPFSYFALTEKYLDPDFIKGYDYSNNQGNGAMFALSGTINNNILYIGFNKFSLSRSFNAGTSNPVKAVFQYFLENFQTDPDSLKGLIIDVRNNPGGDISDLNFLIGQLISKPLQIGHFHTKRGSNPFDFTPWISVTIPPSSDLSGIEAPIIVLVDNFSASLSEVVAMAVHSLPNGLIIGEQTYGATGPITSHDIYNAGGFVVGNFLSVETSSVAFKYVNSNMYEGKGFPPDIVVPYNSASITQGIDLALQQAIEIIN